MSSFKNADAGATSCYFIITTIGSTAKSLL